MLPDDWLAELRAFEGVSPIQLHRNAAIRLIQVLDDIPHAQAGVFLGIPYNRGLMNGAAITAWLRRTGKAPEYFQRSPASPTASSRLHTSTTTCAASTFGTGGIPDADRARIVIEVTRTQRPHHRKLATWHSATRPAATIYVWSQVTRSERILHLYLTSDTRPATTDQPSLYRLARFISTPGVLPRPSPRFENLKHVLDGYCTDVIATLEARADGRHP
ncbi:hypothetical protein [Streptomyces sp. HUAS TT7]|uniref:hypothetical protein n=1 Tax=Streptomyces sp. HUAS TT7 TaxID=3447507 RepID=UPI003F65571D